MSILRQKKIILTAIIPLLLIIGLSIQSYAATISVKHNVLTGLGGITYNVTNTLTVTDPAYLVTLADQSATSIWGNNAVLKTALTKGNWQFQVKVTANNDISNAQHIATVEIDDGSGYRTLAGTITFTAAIQKGDSAYLIFDMGTSELPTNSALVVTIT